MTNVTPVPAGAPDIDRVISENVTLLIYRANDSKFVVANELGISPSALSHKLKGRRPWSATEIDTLARRFNVSRDALFARVPGLDPNRPLSD